MTGCGINRPALKTSVPFGTVFYPIRPQTHTHTQYTLAVTAHFRLIVLVDPCDTFGPPFNRLALRFSDVLFSRTLVVLYVFFFHLVHLTRFALGFSSLYFGLDLSILSALHLPPTRENRGKSQ